MDRTPAEFCVVAALANPDSPNYDVAQTRVKGAAVLCAFGVECNEAIVIADTKSEPSVICGRTGSPFYLPPQSNLL